MLPLKIENCFSLFINYHLEHCIVSRDPKITLSGSKRGAYLYRSVRYTIFISYREFKKDFARSGFFYELRYDLGQSDIIVFRQYRIRLNEASNEYVRFMVIADKWDLL